MHNISLYTQQGEQYCSLQHQRKKTTDQVMFQQVQQISSWKTIIPVQWSSECFVVRVITSKIYLCTVKFKKLYCHHHVASPFNFCSKITAIPAVDSPAGYILLHNAISRNRSFVTSVILLQSNLWKSHKKFAKAKRPILLYTHVQCWEMPGSR